MNRWEATPPHEWSDAWEGQLQITYDYDTKTDACGHLHESAGEAEQCAPELAARLNATLMSLDARIPNGMPSDYYLG
jgi:hypothetical protein